MALSALPLMRDRAGERHRDLVGPAARSRPSRASSTDTGGGSSLLDTTSGFAGAGSGRHDLGGLLDAGHIIDTVRPAEVLVTIPAATGAHLDSVVAACAAAGVTCRYVRRETTLETPTLVEATHE
jgi:hypothetical protein